MLQKHLAKRLNLNLYKAMVSYLGNTQVVFILTYFSNDIFMFRKCLVHFLHVCFYANLNYPDMEFYVGTNID